MLRLRGTASKAVLTFILLITFSATAANNSSFSDEELLNTSPFGDVTEYDVLKDTLKLMNVDLDVSIELPVVLVSEEITEDQTEIIAAAEKQGMPFWAFAKGINMYLLDLNLIILGKEMKIHNLAHEYTHYIQVMYKGYTLENFNESLEYEAITIQNNFRD